MPYKDPERTKEYQKQWYQKNKERVKKTCSEWYFNNKEHVKRVAKQWEENNKLKRLEKKRQWRLKNKKYTKNYFQTNKEQIYKNRQKKYRNDTKFNLSYKTSRLIAKTLRNNKGSKHWESLVEYSLNNLIKHLKSTMPNGYTWQDYLNGKLHIDHIIPIKAFSFTSPEDEDFKNCWCLENLRLLPKEENFSKNMNITNPILLGLLIHNISNPSFA